MTGRCVCGHPQHRHRYQRMFTGGWDRSCWNCSVPHCRALRCDDPAHRECDCSDYLEDDGL